MEVTEHNTPQDHMRFIDAWYDAVDCMMGYKLPVYGSFDLIFGRRTYTGR